jgi:hypothetical protein
MMVREPASGGAQIKRLALLTFFLTQWCLNINVRSVYACAPTSSHCLWELQSAEVAE